jgi:osmotically inducible protein OsmC
MAISNASAVWKGNLVEGSGTMKLEKGAYEGPFTRASRFETGPGTNPEEMILSKSGFPPAEIRTSAKVHMGDGPAITLIELVSEGDVPGCDEAAFLEHAEKAKAGCPVSKALSAVPMTLTARLVK